MRNKYLACDRRLNARRDGWFARIDKGAAASYLKAARGRLRELGSERASLIVETQLWAAG